ncbi:uncharacterized protein H6S33_004527 [Morchella sextelata]|uniref:uncharacterized protein n=1 Tax=Morchella sextelata TaxID=1174677 RepID=UPI001D056958|nr:uncharacterized protein H6S33_004527 [Morchella sextelata]KAH0605305.1 hypothetical protein H6S33_004527 [Morchella sextelata]
MELNGQECRQQGNQRTGGQEGTQQAGSREVSKQEDRRASSREAVGSSAGTRAARQVSG